MDPIVFGAFILFAIIVVGLAVPRWSKPIAIGMISILVIAITACSCIASAVFFCVPRILDPIATVSVGSDREVLVYSDHCWWEQYRPLWYQVQGAGKVIVPESRLGVDFGIQHYEFKVVFAANQSMVGIFDPSQSLFDYQFIIVDFKTGESWPQSYRTIEEYHENERKGFTLFEQLQQENPDIPRPKDLAP